MKLYKAVRPNGRDFYTDAVQWAPEKVKARKGRLVRHPSSTVADVADLSTFLSVSTDPTRLPGSSWPMRLLVVEPVGDTVEPSEHKRGGTVFRVVEEVDPSERFGPQGPEVANVIHRAQLLTPTEARDLAAAWCAAWCAARGAAQYAAWDAAWALVVRDLIGRHGFTQAHYDTLTGPWRKVVGPVHPDDADLW